jgi:IclR family transcriptional regulator, acetate operon repressor
MLLRRTATKDRAGPSDRMFAVIDCVVANRVPMSVTNIAAQLALPAPTVHRMATQLVARGYLKRPLGSKSFVPGRRLIALGVEIVTCAFGADRCHAMLVSLARRFNEHCHIGIVVDDEVIYVDSARVSRGHGLQFEAGDSAPIYCTSIGKLHLAQLDDDELAELLANLHTTRFTPTTICSPKAIAAEAVRVRKRGWASSNAEYTPGVVGCAAPILGANGRMMAGLGISVPQAHVSFANIRQYVPLMQETAGRIANVVLEDLERVPRSRIA